MRASFHRLPALAAIFCLSSAQAKLVFHFDFSTADGKKELSDQTDTFRCLSESNNFQTEEGALRIAPGARFFIPPEGIPDLSHAMTVTAWVLKSSTPDVSPILFQGLHPDPGGFLFSIGWRYPGFFYKKNSAQTLWDGLFYEGYFGSTIKYPDPSWILPDAKFIETGGTWYQVAAVFNEGAVRVFVDGRPVAEMKSEQPSTLTPSRQPLFIGSEWGRRNDGSAAGIVEPTREANMLLNDLRLYDEALSDKEIAALYHKERPRYPTESQIPAGKTHTTALAPCYAYLGPEYDPNFKRVLKITEEYLGAQKKGETLPSPLMARNTIVGKVPGLSINDKPVYPLAVFPAPRNFGSGESILREAGACVRDFAAAGVDLVGLDVFPQHFWTEEGQYDWSTIDEALRTYLEGNPSAKIVFGLMLYPPPWFEARFPGDVEKYFHGGQFKTMKLAGPLGSERWLAASLKMIRDVVTHVESGPYADHVFAYLCAGGQSGEWYWPGGLDGPTGYSPGTAASFRSWLYEKYKGDADLLRAAWKNGTVDFSSAIPPPPEARNRMAESVFLDPGTARAERDFRTYLTDQTVKNIKASARAAKEASKERKLVYVYYGYSLSAEGRPKLRNNGLQGLARVLDCEDIDSVLTLIDYSKRLQGQAGLGITPFNASARLRGKFIWQEHDIRTHLAKGPFAAEKTRTFQETLTVVQRGFGTTLVEGAGMWWRLFENDWFHQEEVMRGISALQNAGNEVLERDRSSIAEVALVYDEEVPSALANSGQEFLREQIWGTYEAAARMGAPYDVLLLSDLTRPETRDYKMYIFLNAYRDRPEILEAVARKVKKNNALAVWTYAPGYLGENGNSLKGMQALTGISLTEGTLQEKQAMKIESTENPIFKKVGEMNAYFVKPAFFCDDTEARILGTVGGRPAMALREFEDWRSLYSMMPLTREVVQELCDYAGIHVYHRDFDVFNANKSFLLLHTTTAGRKTVTLPQAATVRELLSGQIVAKDTARIVEELPANATRIYAIEK